MTMTRSSGDTSGCVYYSHVKPHLLWTMAERKHKHENGRILGVIVIRGTIVPFGTHGWTSLTDALETGRGHVTGSGQ